MLIKLIKHDILSTYRHILPVYLAVLIVALVGGISAYFNDVSWLNVLIMVSFFASMVALIVSMIVIVNQLFYKRLYTSEGYLNFTLPVSTTETFLSKIITAMFWMFISILVSVSGFLIFVFILSFTNGAIELRQMFSQYGDQIVFFITEMLKMSLYSFPHFVAGTAYSLTLLLFAIVLAQSAYIPKAKVVVGIIVYILLSGIISNISDNISAFTWMSTMMNANTISTTQLFNFDYQIYWDAYFLSIAFYAIIAAALFYGSVWINDRKCELV